LNGQLQQKVIGITVEGTGQSTSVPPLVAPYDFGIDKKWWEEEAGEYPAHVMDWLTHGNPDGFGDEHCWVITYNTDKNNLNATS
jgi:hypothetical protein